MIFVDGLCIIHTPIDARCIVLRDSHNSLNSEKDICDESKNAMRGGEMGAGVGEFVILDDYETGKKAQNGGAIDDCVYIGTEVFLLRSMRWLED